MFAHVLYVITGTQVTAQKKMKLIFTARDKSAKAKGSRSIKTEACLADKIVHLMV